MKTLKQNVAVLETYRTADTLNHEGFPAWTPSDAVLLEQLAMTGTLGHSFYASAREQTRDALELLERAEPEALARAIVRGRQEGFVRAFPILGLVKLSEKSSLLFQEVFDKVVVTGGDLKDFLDLARSMRGLGRGVKRAIHGWLDRKLTPYYAMKYRTAIADAIRLSRYPGNDPLCAFVLSAYDEVKGVAPGKLIAAEEKYPVLRARAEFIAALESVDTATAARLLDEHKLDTDSLTVYSDRFDCEIWSAAAAAAPVMKFLKYLAKYIREGVGIVPIAAEKLSVEALLRARVFPFRLYTALSALEAMRNSSTSDEIRQQESLEQVGRILTGVLDEYAEKYDWELFNRFSWVIAPDISGSMSSPIARSSLTFSELSAMFVGFFMKGLKRVRVLPWNTRVEGYGLTSSASVAVHMNTLRGMVGGGTFMEAPIRYMLENNIAADFAVFLTDTEEYGCGWLALWKLYRRKFPRAQAFLLRADSYQRSPIFEEDAVRYGVWQIFGWNDSVIEFMRYIVEKNIPVTGSQNEN